MRTVEMTPEGKAFIAVAKKWKALFLESKGLVNALEHKFEFNLGVIGSMSTYLLPATFRQFINEHPECNVNIHQYHSEECYWHMEKGELDLALVGKEKYSKTIATVPICKAPFKLVCNKKDLATKEIHPSQLDPAQEIQVPWNNQFQNWHDYWFGASAKPRVWLDMMPLLEYFIADENSWVIAPGYIANYIAKKKDLYVYDLVEAPPAVTVYAIYPKNEQTAFVQKFLQLAKENLESNQGFKLYL